MSLPSKHSIMSSATKRAILEHLVAHGAATEKQMHAGIRRPNWRITAGTEPTEHQTWLSGHIGQMRLGGFLLEAINASGQIVYSLSPRIAAELAPTEGSAPAQDARSQLEVAAPRRVYVMNTPPYAPPRPAPVRPGAMAYAALPSRVGSRLVPHTTGSIYS